MSGGTIISDNGNAINNFGEVNYSGTAQLRSGSASYPTLYNNSTGVARITGGTISNTANGYAIYNVGTATLSGATVNGGKYGV